VIASEEQLTDQQPVAPIDYTSEMDVPLLGIFGNEDSSPTPEDVDKTEEILKKAGKEYEFFRYDEAGHGFFAVDRPGYRPVQATEAWGEVFRFYKQHLT
jgi:carboxymethylenebutenolidase